MEGYNGWKSIGDLAIVYSDYDTMEFNGKRYYKAYVTEAKNKKSIESAIKWATGHYSKDQKKAEPKIINTTNDDFSFQVVSAAGNSWSQGGKLSFWMCLMEKKGVEPFVVGINSDLLCDFILETTLTNGKSNHRVFFARNYSQLGILHKDMATYQELLHDEQLKKNLSKGKTTKWKIGYAYNTLTQSDTMFGMFAKIISFDYNYSNGCYYRCDSQLTINLDFTKPDYALFGYTKENPKMSDVYKEVVEDLSYDYLKPKCPSRQEGEQIFEETSTYYDDLVTYILAEKNDATVRYYSIVRFIHVAFAIFRHDKEATIKMLERTKATYNKYVEELYASDKFPAWVSNADWYERNITDSVKRNRAWGTLRSEAELRKEKKDEILRDKFYEGSTKPINLCYNGSTQEFTDWSHTIDRLIEIVKKEK